VHLSSVDVHPHTLLQVLCGVLLQAAQHHADQLRRTEGAVLGQLVLRGEAGMAFC
jgi:hypothetical protein